MNSEKMREEFEEFHRKHLEEMGMDESDIASEFDRKDDGEYLFSMAADAWPYWQASRAAVVVELPPVPEVPEDPEEAIDDSYMDAYHSAVRMRQACAQSITSVGLKVKP